jgi:hypothetical protein
MCRACQATRRAAARVEKQAQATARVRPAMLELSPQTQKLLTALTDYGQARGWTPTTLNRARQSLTALAACYPLAGAEPLDAAAVRAFLLDRHLVALRVLEFLTDQGLAHGDNDESLDRWLAARLAGLPTPIRTEVHAWIDVLRGRGPRRHRARKATTIQGYLRVLDGPLADWTGRYESLRQLTSEDLTAHLAALTGATRLLTLAAMRSLFTTLKSQRVIFANPAARLVAQRMQPPPALPIDPHLRAGLLTRLNHPHERLIVLLAGVHALRTAQICQLSVDDCNLVTGTLLVDDQRRRLDDLTRQQLRAWLDVRRARWPTTANPHLLVNQSTAGGLKPVSRSFVQTAFRQLGNLTPHDLRVDRILDEVHATGGDPLTLTRVLGLSDPTALRYCAELGPLDQQPEHSELAATDSTQDLQ